MTDQAWADIRITARDGLRLHARGYGDRLSDATPVLCLAGLTRNASDFHELAMHLASAEGGSRYVLCLDMRGRGGSEWDRDWRNYSLLVEADDVQHALAACGMRDVFVVGTSRGGLLTMVLACARPGVLAGAVFNDVGPEIDGRGLARLKNYVGRMPGVTNWDQAAGMMENLFAAKFPALDPSVWERYARGTFSEKNGRLLPSYDPGIAKPLAQIDLTDALPTMWPQFQAMTGMPLMVLRGENSDILSAVVLERMGRVHPRMQSHTVPGHGHAPWLAEPELRGMIVKFLRAAEQGHGRPAGSS